MASFDWNSCEVVHLPCSHPTQSSSQDARSQLSLAEPSSSSSELYKSFLIASDPESRSDSPSLYEIQHASAMFAFERPSDPVQYPTWSLRPAIDNQTRPASGNVSFGFSLQPTSTLMMPPMSLSESFSSSGYESLHSMNMSGGLLSFTSDKENSSSSWSSPFLNESYTRGARMPSTSLCQASRSFLSTSSNFLALYNMLKPSVVSKSSLRFESTPNKALDIPNVQATTSFVAQAPLAYESQAKPAKASSNCIRKINFHSVLDLADGSTTNIDDQEEMRVPRIHVQDFYPDQHHLEAFAERHNALQDVRVSHANFKSQKFSSRT